MMITATMFHLCIVSGMNIRMPQSNQATAPDSSSGPPLSNVAEGSNTDTLQSNTGSANQMPGYSDGANFGASSGMPMWAPHGMGPGGMLPHQQGAHQEERRSVSSCLIPAHISIL